MSLQANLKDFKLAHLIEFISASKKTGTLRIVRPGAEGFIYFRNGKAFFAASSANRKSIGERLVEAGKITRQELSRALELQESEGRKRRLGDILTSEGFVDSEELRIFIKQQIYDSIFDLCQWKEGEFAFQAEESPTGEDIGLSFEEWQRIEEKLARLSNFNPAKKKLLNRTNYYGQAVEIDGQGRLLLPSLLRQDAQLKGEVAVLGMLNHLEVRNMESFRKEMAENPFTDEDEKTLDELGI